MVRALLAVLLAIGIVTLVVLPQPGSYLIALLVMLAVFLIAAARLAIDLVELDPVELLADAGLLVATGFALTQVPLGNAHLTEWLFAAGIVTQVVPLALRRRALRRTSGS
jgi:hypothetical protein